MIARLHGDREFVQDLTEPALIEPARFQPDTDTSI